MTIGDIKTFDITYTGLRLQIIAIDTGDGQTRFEIKCLEGSADVNALYWGDGDKTVDSASESGGFSGFGAKSDSSLNMNGSGEVWDGGLKLSSAGLGSDGVNKATYLTAGESLVVDANVSWSFLDTLGVRATSTSTAGGSIKGVDGDAVVTECPAITIDDRTVTEGTDASATFTVSLDHTYAYDITITYATANGTAASGSDYQSGTGSVTILAGHTSATISVAIVDDAVNEPTEAFVVNLTGATANIPDNPLDANDHPTLNLADCITDAQGTGTILDNDPLPPPPPPPHPEYWGLSQGFWSNPNGLLDWDLNKTDSFEALFGVNTVWDDTPPFNNGSPALADVTLLQALSLGGGGQNQLANQAVAAALNASDEDLHYRYTLAQIKTMVQDAFDGDNTDGFTIASVAAELEFWNAHAGANDEGHIYAQQVNTLHSDII